MRSWLCLALLAAALVAPLAKAVPVDNLYQADVPVEDRSSATRNKMMDAALAQVLVKITGNPTYLNDATLSRAIRQSSKYVQAYSYSSDASNNTFLNARFSSTSINNLLKQAGVPLWPENRPRVLVWLARRDYQTGTEILTPNTILGGDPSQTIYQRVAVDANMKGLPVVQPLMDLEDQMQIAADQLWALDSAVITAASQRYKPDSILVGRITATSGGQWRISWWYLQDTQFEVFDSTAEAIDPALEQGLGALTAYLASIYAVPITGSYGVALNVEIGGIDGFADYAGVVRYLSGLAAVQGYQLRQVTPHRLALTLYLSGDSNQLRDALALDKKLEPVTGLGVDTTAAMQLRWRSDAAL
ncbi:DUF2066 domain-containing protein [Halioxenophilus sp. WMMB6]|uniref:DUF2066 domain-containing protein n=1 Tax=Halioxenophilus sp. WMMB6 TaxID=3073815 RepID=UPI00295F335E|nr:DUF2066 domain-containing protein [Halioxenophilus sp. WMMB6]